VGARNKNQKYFFSPELRGELRLAYCHKKHELTAALDRLETKTEWPRWAFKLEATRLGLTTRDHRRGWTTEEDAYLAEHVGRVPIKSIANKLGRSFESVQARAERLKLSRCPQDGYNITDLAAAFGESMGTIRKWMERGLFGKVHRKGGAHGARVTERNVMLFIRLHSPEYDLRRVEQAWFKGLAFSANQNCGQERFALSMRKR